MQKTKSIALILGVLAMSILVGYFVLAWTEPGASPPGGNVPAPINVGTVNQIKAGGLGISGGFFTDSPTLVVDAVNDRVGIGTASPGVKLDVQGGRIRGQYEGQFNSASIGAVGWYRIASNSGNRANAEFTLRDYISGGGHSTLTFRAGVSYDWEPGMSFTLLNHSYYSTPTFTKVRVWESDYTYDPMYVEVYVARTGSMDYSIYDNLQSGGWTPVAWTAGGTPTGTGTYTAREFEVNNLFTVGDYDDRFTITRGGNVGIGTTGPSQKLDVNGNIVAQGSVGATQYCLNPSGGCVTSWAQIAGTGGWTDDGTTVRLTTVSDNVGIGTASPGAKLHVASGLIETGTRSVKQGLSFVDSCGTTRVTSVHNGIWAPDYSTGCGDEWFIGVQDRDGGEASTLVIGMWNDANDHIALMPSGNVGIGTAGPGYKLDVQGGIVNVGAGYGFHTVTNDSWFPYVNGWNYFRGNTYAWNAVWYDENNSAYYLDPSGTSAYNDLRANIFYDRENTGYYVDPASASRLNAVVPNIIALTTGDSPNAGYNHYAIYEQPGAWTSPYPDLMIEYHTGISYIAYYGYGGHRFYTGYNPDASPNTLAFSVGEFDNNTRVYNNLYVSGNVGIGTTAPGARLDLEGGNIIDVNKISVNTIDPIFKINNKKYASYAPDVIGKKVEVIGVGKLTDGKWEINLANQEDGSDLWLFYNIVKRDTIVPFISSQDKADLYSYLDGTKFVVELKDGGKEARFSYLLIGERIDSQQDENVLSEEEAEKVGTYINVDSLR